MFMQIFIFMNTIKELKASKRWLVLLARYHNKYHNYIYVHNIYVLIYVINLHL